MTEPAAPKRCVICGKPQVERYKPFCSKRCADVDLHRWFSGAYTVPGTADEDEDGSAGVEKGSGKGRD
jgi:endogenous inhibitor of DNA gyrase (YacG/DUF329 family)